MPRRYLGSFVTYNPVEPTASAASGMWPLNQQFQEISGGTWPLTFGDPYFNYTTLLLSSTSLSNANNNLFVDSSGAFNPISRTGNATQGSFAPYGTYWSNYSDNSGDYLTAGSGSSAFAFGTGNFTIEGWFYSNASVANWKPMLSVGAAAQGQLIRINQGLQFTGNWGMLYPNDAGNADVYFDTGSPFPLNQWVHVALVRNGTTLTLYQNGVNVLQKTVGFNFTNTTGVAIGYGQYPADGVFGGYMSNIRIVKGTAVYTANFTPPTTPLTAISGTSLLTCQSNRFRDASSNNFAVTPAGDIRVTDFSPFLHTAPIQYNQSDITNWSGYFANTDYLQIAGPATGTGTWTVEGWFYFTSFPGGPIFAQGTADTTSCWFLYLTSSGGLNFYSNGDISSSAGGVVTANTWVHIALVSNASTATTYVNGTSVASGSYAGKVFTGSPFQLNRGYGGATTGNPCYQSNVRMVVGTAVYTSNFTPPTSPLTAISGTALLTCQSAAFTDNSANKYLITSSGTPTVTGNSPFNTVGYWSNYFDGAGDNLKTPSNAAFAYGTGDFTWEMWVFPTSSTWTGGSSNFYLLDHGSNGGVIQYYANVIRYYNPTTGFGVLYNDGGSIPVNAWTHIAVSRQSGTTRLFVNGVLKASASDTHNYGNNVVTVADYGSGGYGFPGYMSNVRIVKGTAVYTASFTPPTTPLTAITNTSLLTCQNNRFIDNSTNAFTLTVAGNTSVQSLNPFYSSTIGSSGGSMYFDGSADYIEPSWSSTSLPGSWTFECWFYATAASGMIFDCRPNSTNGYYPNVSIASSTQIDFYYNANSNLITVPGGTINKWIHLAVVKNGTSLVVYLDGVSSFSTTDSNTWAIGASRPRIGANGGYYSAAPAPLTGYISNFRILNGTAAYTGAFTPPTAPTSPTPNTILMLNGMNAGIYDATATNDFETVGNAQVTTAVSKFGGSSVYFDGTGDYLSTRAGSDLMFGTGDVTLECWLYLNSTAGTQTIAARWATPRAWLWQFTSSTMTVYFGTTGTSFSWSPATGTWYHLAITRSSGNTRFFVNGLQTGSTQTNNGDATNTGIATIGINDDGIQQPINGYIDDFRITKGYARYTSNFTPPTAALPTY